MAATATADEETTTWTPDAVRALRTRLGLSLEEAARKVGVRPRTWLSWELASQGRKPSASAMILLRWLDKGDF